MLQTREHMLLSRQAGLPNFVTKVDTVDDRELLDLVELEVRELLSQYQYSGNEASLMRSLAAKAVDSSVPLSERPIDEFWMPIEDVFSIPGRGILSQPGTAHVR